MTTAGAVVNVGMGARRFVPAPGESIHARVELRADTPELAAAGVMIYVTDSNIVLCHVPTHLFAAAELCLVAAAIALGGAYDRAAPVAVALVVLAMVVRSFLRFTRIATELSVHDISGISAADNALILSIADGSNWRLQPARWLVFFRSPLGGRNLRSVAKALAHCLGHSPQAPGLSAKQR